MLSQKARTFKVRAMQTIQKDGRVALLSLKHDVPYELKLTIFFEAVLNSAQAASKFKKIDIGNRLKLIEDTVSEALDLDDSHNFRVVLEKHCDPETPGLYVDLKEVAESEVGLTKEAYDGRNRLPRPELHGVNRPLSKAWLSTCSPGSGKGLPGSPSGRKG